MQDDDDSQTGDHKSSAKPSKKYVLDKSRVNKDDDEEDDEEYDDEDPKLGGFIVSDEDVEESGEESKSTGKEHRRHKKHKAPKIKQLDDDDFDLIQENTGQELARKKKRLQKVADAEAPVSRIVKRDED